MHMIHQVAWRKLKIGEATILTLLEKRIFLNCSLRNYNRNYRTVNVDTCNTFLKSVMARKFIEVYFRRNEIWNDGEAGLVFRAHRSIAVRLKAFILNTELSGKRFRKCRATCTLNFSSSSSSEYHRDVEETDLARNQIHYLKNLDKYKVKYWSIIAGKVALFFLPRNLRYFLLSIHFFTS